MKRRALVLAGLGFLVVLAGCTGGGREIPDRKLVGDAEYEWNTTETVTYTLHDADRFSFSGETYATVIAVQNRSSVSVNSRGTLRGQTSIPITALKFRFTNGTVINASHANLTALSRNDRTEIRLPAKNGSVAYTASRNGKQWGTPAPLNGSYAVRLPPNAAVGLPYLSRVAPRGYEKTRSDGRLTLRWTNVEDDTLIVRYYLARDLYIFGSLGVLLAFVGFGGLLYYVRQIRAAQKKREEVGLDVEMEDDERGNGPPPGMN